MDLDSKIFLITGANSGIGFETAKALVKRKARIIFACRDLNKANAAIEEIRKEQPTGGELIPMQLDIASFESIENFAKCVKAEFPRIDVLINNAGVVVPLREDQKTKEGFEIHFGTNHLGHFYLTNLLLDVLKKSTPSRVVVVSSRLHERGVVNFDDLNLRREIELAKTQSAPIFNPGYCNSKLMNAYFMRALAEKLRGTGVDVVACCPGLCSTNLGGRSMKWYQYIIMLPLFLFSMQSPQKGSETVVLCATGTIESGKFYRDCTEYHSKLKFDKDTETRLWKVSEELVKARRPL